MSTTLYTVTSRKLLFNGKQNVEDVYKKFAMRAHAHDCNVLLYIVGDREWMGNFTLNGHVCDLYRYTDTAFVL